MALLPSTLSSDVQLTLEANTLRDVRMSLQRAKLPAEQKAK